MPPKRVPIQAAAPGSDEEPPHPADRHAAAMGEKGGVYVSEKDKERRREYQRQRYAKMKAAMQAVAEGRAKPEPPQEAEAAAPPAAKEKAQPAPTSSDALTYLMQRLDTERTKRRRLKKEVRQVLGAVVSTLPDDYEDADGEEDDEPTPPRQRSGRSTPPPMRAEDLPPTPAVVSVSSLGIASARRRR